MLEVFLTLGTLLFVCMLVGIVGIGALGLDVAYKELSLALDATGRYLFLFIVIIVVIVVIAVIG